MGGVTRSEISLFGRGKRSLTVAALIGVGALTTARGFQTEQPTRSIVVVATNAPTDSVARHSGF